MVADREYSDTKITECIPLPQKQIRAFERYDAAVPAGYVRRT